jgi:hypothetical protein
MSDSIPRETEWQMPMRAFEMMTLAERVRVLEAFSALKYPSIADRFFDAIHTEIMRHDDIRQQVEAARREGRIHD